MIRNDAVLQVLSHPWCDGLQALLQCICCAADHVLAQVHSIDAVRVRAPAHATAHRNSRQKQVDPVTLDEQLGELCFVLNFLCRFVACVCLMWSRPLRTDLNALAGLIPRHRDDLI